MNKKILQYVASNDILMLIRNKHEESDDQLLSLCAKSLLVSETKSHSKEVKTIDVNLKLNL